MTSVKCRPRVRNCWLRPVMDIVSTLPVNTQSWSYRLVAGRGFHRCGFRRLEPLDTLAGKGTVSVASSNPRTSFPGRMPRTRERHRQSL
jgi:hypothetical protein